MNRFQAFVCCTALALIAATAARAGIMNPIPTDPITIESGKLSGTLTVEAKIPRYDPRHEQRLIFGDAGLTLETLNQKQVDFIENHPPKRN